MLPSFNGSGVLPPFLGDGPDERQAASPYKASMSELVVHFGYTPERRRILRGLLDFRHALRSVAIVTGFQIIDGSFLEDCERTRSRPPSDIDLVTFSHLPVPAQEATAFLGEHIALFDTAAVKQAYACDAYFVDLAKDARYVVQDTIYWYGLFSHQRDTFMWKGLVTIPMLSDDNQALIELEKLEVQDAQAA
ncbi:DUF6932 family protein [Delftia acidovorans]|uniref:DUF6932 family protein n=1 Tax=Delftia acidovorans TaxID=80866 RepID=UPI0039F688AA